MTPPPSRSERFFETLSENGFEGMAIVDAEGVITFQNRAAAHILGADYGQLIGTNAVSLIHPDDLAEAMSVLADLNQKAGVPRPNEVRMRRQDTGEYVQLEVRAVNLSQEPAVAGIVINFRDVSTERNTLRALQASETRLELALEGAGLGFWDWDIDRNVLTYSGRVFDVLGISKEDLGNTLEELLARVHPDELPSLNDALAGHLEGHTEFFECEHRLRGREDKYRWLVARGKVVERHPDGKPKRMSGTQLDVDERHRTAHERMHLEEQLQQVQRIESIGQLAGGIAHDFNNILQVISAYASLATDDIDNRENLTQALTEITHASEKAAQLTTQLLAFGRRQAIRPAPSDINQLIQSHLGLMRRVIPENIAFDFIPGHRLATGFVDPGQFEQVLTNLCLNARDAMPEGGRLTVETENVVINGEYRQRHPWAKSGRYVLVTVTDTGHGMDSVVQARAFEPFFTTKMLGEGSGLGLAMVHGIVRQHDGLVHLYSEIGIGTAFKLYWPAVERQAQSVGSKLEGPVPRGRERLLVVEDEESVRRLVAQILMSAGYEVLTAADGDEAVRVFAARQNEIALVLLDAVMPKRNGREVYEYIRSTHPVPVLFTSGYSTGSLPADFLSRYSLDVLPKPYSPDLLLRKVRQTLDGKPPGDH